MTMIQTPAPAAPLRVLLTAAEAYPALEEAFLSATTEIWGSFLVFDPRTRLRSAAGRAVGEIWFDLIVHRLRAGVAIHLVISDVDPVGRADMHLQAARSRRMLLAAGEVAGKGAKLTVTLARHPAETGLGIRLAIWPYILHRQRKLARWLNAMPPHQRTATWRDLPGAVHLVRMGPSGWARTRLWPLPRLWPLVHHQKLAVIDRQTLYIGGLDLDERRFDTPRHGQSADQTWHDVQLMLQGPVVADAQEHLQGFLAQTAGRDQPRALPHLLRTLAAPGRGGAFGFGPRAIVRDLRAVHLELIRGAQTLIYLESQYMRDLRLARRLAAAARARPGLSLILILPARPDDVAFDAKTGLDSRLGEALQARALRVLRRAYGARLFVGSPAQRRWAEGEDVAEDATLHGAPIVYVHAKVSIFDDHAAVVSSANLNGRSFNWDTEAGVRLNDKTEVQTLRDRVMRHWLPQDAAPEALAPATAAQAWARLARHNARLPPPERRGFLLPHDFARAEAFGRTLPLIPDEIV